MADSPHGAAAPACGANCGITRNRERQKAQARALAARAYPGLVWTASPVWSPGEPPIGRDEVVELAAGLEQVVPGRVLARADEPGSCDALWVLAGLHAPCWLEVRDEPDGDELPAVAGETYLRVALSPLGRYYTLQEVRITATAMAGGLWIEEQRIVGVEDRRLQLFVKATQGFLGKRRLTGLDAAFLAEPAASAHELDAPATLYALLFEPVPAGLRRGDFVPTGAR
jgi:hypothetical protein